MIYLNNKKYKKSRYKNALQIGLQIALLFKKALLYLIRKKNLAVF